MLRHERMSVAMAHAESSHHSAQRQKTARAGGEARDALHGLVREAPLSHGHVLRHVVGHLSVLALDVPVPPMVHQLPDIEQFFRALSPDPELVIEVPKILPFDVPMRAAVRVPQLAEQAGGSADDHILFLVTAVCGAARRHSSSWWWRTNFWSSRVFLWTEFNSDAFLQETHF